MKKYFILTVLYFVSRLIYLTRLPLFNDEAIYIDWGFREINSKGFLFYSLYDGKPPLLMWLFGISGKFISDPLLAARLISVIAGFLALLGIYKLTDKYFGGKTAMFASLFYIVVPLFAFFDRQALMESAIAAVGIWSIYFFLKFLERPKSNNYLFLGIVWGIGIFIKQTTLVFIITEVIIYLFLIKKKIYHFNQQIILSFVSAITILIPLLVQSQFWNTLNSNSRFSLSITEILSFPLSTWATNSANIFLGSFWYFSIPFLVLTVLGIQKSKEASQKITAFYFLICLIIIMFTARTISPRYLMPFLPLSTVFIGYFLHLIKNKFLMIILFFVSIIYPLIFTFLLVFSPLKYFSLLNKFTPLSQESEYVSGWTSGYAAFDAINFIKSKAQEGRVAVGVRVDAGNPESAVFAYFEGSREVRPMYFDSKFIDPGVLKYDCLSSGIPFYFVSRNGNLAGMDKFLIEEKIFKNPTGNNFVSVYSLKKDCKDKILKMNF